MAEPMVTQNLITAEARRRLAPIAYSENTVKTLDLPRDTVVKRAHVDLVLTCSVTFASGSPIAHSAGVAARICPRLDIIIDGQRTVKSIDIAVQEQLNAIYAGKRPRRAYSTSSTAFTTTRAGTEAPRGAAFVYPATTEYLLINEHFVLHFENPWAYALGREATMLNLKNVSSAEARFSFGALSQIQREGSPASVTYGAIDGQFVTHLIEAREVPANTQFFDFKEVIKREQFSAETRDRLIDLPRGNGLAGVALMVRNGDANKSLSDLAVTDLQLLINGQQIIQRTKFKELQDANQARYGVDDDLSSNDHVMEGFAFMNLLKNGDIRSAINTSIGAGVDQVQLAVSTAASSGTDAATYTNPVEATIWTQEIAAVPVRAS